MRTDCHRPGAIVPADYTYMLSYLMPGSEPFDSYGIQEARALCESIQWGRNDRKMFGHMGKCGVCGAHYREGQVWLHIPTNDLLHIGHDCADKYELLANDPDFNTALEMIKIKRKAMIQAEHNRRIRQAFFDANPGIEEALQGEHYILADLSSSLNRWHSLTDAQVKLAFKIAADLKEKASQPKEVNVPAPTGKQVVKGVVVSKKRHESMYGESLKMTVKVFTAPYTCWLCWGTVPSSLECKIGDTVEFKATLEAGRDPHFVFFKRPTKARNLTTEAPAEDKPSDTFEV